MVTQGCHVDASITHSPRKPKTRPSYEVVADREDRDDEEDAKAAMRVILFPSVDSSRIATNVFLVRVFDRIGGSPNG